jgi:hypothetical protein
MGWFQSKEEQLAESLREEQAYAVAAYEIANSEIRPGLWAKAFARANGNEHHAQGIYIKLRVEQVKLGVEVTAEMITRVERLLSAKTQVPAIEPPKVAPRLATTKWRCLRCGPTTAVTDYAGKPMCSRCRGQSCLCPTN